MRSPVKGKQGAARVAVFFSQREDAPLLAVYSIWGFEVKLWDFKKNGKNV